MVKNNPLRPHFLKAVEHHRAGRLREAEQGYRAAIKAEPKNAAAHHLLGVLAIQAGRHAEGEQSIRRAIGIDPGQARYYCDLGVALKGQDKQEEALAAYDRALALDPEHAQAHNNRGNLLERLGRTAEALAAYERVLSLQPAYPEAHNNRGLALLHQGRNDEALAAFSEAAALKPDYAEAHCNRADALAELGRPEEALAAYDRALAINPGLARAHNNRGNALKDLGRYAEALAAYERAVQFQAEYADAQFNRGNILKDEGRVDEALAAFDEALRLKPDYAEARWARAMAWLPPCYDSVEHVEECRAAYTRALDDLAGWHEQARGTEKEQAWRAVGTSQPFYLAYHGENDRDLQSRYGRLAAAIMEDWREGELPGRVGSPGAGITGTSGPESQIAIPYPGEYPEAAPGRSRKKIRVGFVSGQMHRHSVWDVLTRGFITHLDRARFDVCCYHTGWRRDAETDYAQARSDRFVQGPLPFAQWVGRILEDRPDVLIYPEIGMDPVTVKLGALRLAPLQAVAWGHPVTSGLPGMDYFLSGELLEPADADAHYSEKLIRLPRLGCCFEHPDIEAAEVGLRELGIPDDPAIVRFVCPQQVSKYHPRYDAVYVRIAAEVQRCRFIFFELGRTQAACRRFRGRLEAAFRAAGLAPRDYCVFLPPLPRERFLGLLHKMDVYLDTIAFSGFTTAMQALGCNGLPVVTVEGEFLRSRLAAAILRRIGVTDTVAAGVDGYVRIAVRLARDPAWRAEIRRRTSAQLELACNDVEAVRALEEFLIKGSEGVTR